MILEGDNLHRYQELNKQLSGKSSWREIATICSSGAQLFNPVLPGKLAEAEDKLSIRFPDDLKALYSETDGMLMNHGASVVMSINELIEENSNMRDRTQFGDLYMSFDNLLLCGQAGNGDFWAYGILMDGTVSDLNMYGWDHENDARPWVASNLRDLLMRVGLGILLDAANA